ncbi:hypothetical protein CYMTET_37497 [Cymbomonas tetramitiformis]|uniref:Reverse transcriptase domain-containing protein n=1 Tax=Cymbomonas tetramitiformis TaxID=36881 RepID=A0AAE0CDT4_9CHLO|nr:hypothetical protein CYMTET_37497 [Cymbomonas tetramitiformis]
MAGDAARVAKLPFTVSEANAASPWSSTLRADQFFIDDYVVFSNTVEEHYEHCRIFLDTCREKGVYLKASKAKLCKESLRFLGHTLSAKGCQPQHDKIAAVKTWPALESVTHVRQFLGLAGYYRRFVHHFSEIAQPLTSLTKTDTPWAWGPQQQWAFEELKPYKFRTLCLPCVYLVFRAK